MRTIIRIRFPGDTAAAVQEQLRAAQCGPDVATLEDVPALRQVFAEVTLERSDPRVLVLVERLGRDGVPWGEWHEDVYTEVELEGARLLMMHPAGQFEIDGGVKWGTTFDLTGACPACATGCRQTSALFVSGKDVPGLEGHRACQTFFWHILVDDRLAADLESIAATGLSFRSVYAVMPDNRQVKLRWKQLCAESTLPPMSPRTTGLDRNEPCKVCSRNGYVVTSEAPTRVVYRAADLRGALDVNQTWENMWFARVNRDFSKSILSRPWIIVTPRVRQVFRDAGVTELQWFPIRVEES